MTRHAISLVRIRRGRPLRAVCWLALAAVAALAGIAAVPPGPAFAGIPAGGMSAAQLNGAFTVYGDTGGEWNGGDSTASVALPDGRVVWLFSDTFLGPINTDGTRPRNSPFVHNTIVIQDGAQPVDTLTGGSAAFPKSLVGADRDGETDNAGYWVGDGIVEGDSLRVLYNHYRKTGTGALDVELTGTWLATFALPSLSLQSLTDLGLGTRTAWGSAILADGAYTYVYGAEFAAGGMKFARVARVPAGGLGGSWQYWTGSAWSAQQDESVRVLSGVGTAYAVQRVGSEYVLVTMEGNLVFNPTVVAYTATAPTGPFTGPLNLYTAPEPQPGAARIVYDTRLHPDLARSGKLLVSYNANSLNGDDNYTDAGLYRPRFIEVDWPRPNPAPGTLPAAPTSLAATVDEEGVVHLTWAAVTGATRYWLYQKDLTAGQTHVARLPGGVTATAMDPPGLLTGHTYEFSVAAENGAGEGPRSEIATAVPKVPPPVAPTGVTAVSNTTGQVTVEWAQVARATGYQVFHRDVTSGQTEFQGLAKVGYTQTSQQVEWLTNNHEYEFHVVAENTGGPSPASHSVRVTVRFDAPAEPTGLTATANPDGGIDLKWTASGTGAWYWVYQRDVTAGETEFTKLSLPISEGTEMTAGLLTHNHVYEYAVSAFNPGGESTKSDPARAIARFPAPGAPGNLRATAADGEVTLTWDATSPDHWYWVYQRDVTAGETEFTKLPLPATKGTLTAGYLTNAHEYEFKVAAIAAGSVEGAASAAVRVRPNVPLPGKPTDLTATAAADGSITLRWNTPSANVYHWIYRRDVTAGEDWQKLEYPADGTTATQGGLKHGHRYEFKVAATNSAGDGPTSDVTAVVCFYNKPPAPTGLRGNTDGDGYIDVNWAPAGEGLYYWTYWRDVTAGETAFTKAVYPTDKTSARMGPLRHGHVYEFKVSAENQGGEGSTSTAIRVTATGGLPAMPTGLSVTGVGDGQVSLRWTASPTANVYYWVEFKPAGGSWQRTSLPLTTCCTFTLQHLANGTTYEFRVRATNTSGDSTPSNVVSARPMPPIPAAPVSLSAAAGDSQVTLRWAASTTPNVYYWVEFRANGGGWQRIKYPIDSCCAFTLSLLINGTNYEFRVRATNLAGDSAPSPSAFAKPMPPFPQPPRDLRVTPGLGKATLTWAASPTGNVYYWVEFKPAGQGWQRAKYPVTTCCSFTADYLTAASYEFRVRATNLSGDSNPSNTVAVSMPLPPKPSGVRAERAGPYQAKLFWNPVPGADAYIIYHGTGNAVWEYPDLKPLQYPVMGGNTSSLTVGYLLEPRIHFFAVAAVKYGREGPKSDLAMTTPLMESWAYYQARWRYFDGPTSQGERRAVTGARQAVDGGIILARAWIDGGGAGQYLPIGDGFMRGFTSAPTASARIHVAWDTGRGQLGALAQKSCHPFGCADALPIRFSQSSAGDTQEVPYNYVWQEAGAGDSLAYHWKASNSVTNNLWLLGWHIDTRVSMWRTSGNRYAASLYTDHFPSYEVYQYPRWTELGFPETYTLVRCGQGEIGGLTDAPNERRTCS